MAARARPALGTCPWDENTCYSAAAGGQLSVLRWLRSQDPPCPWDVDTCAGAANNGHLDAMNNLGVIYDQGKLVEEDNTEAAHWYMKAADQGHNDALFNLGLLYQRGSGVDQDLVAAARSYEAAAHAVPAAAFNLALLHEKGLGGFTADSQEAQRWLKMAADGGHRGAQRRLGGEI